MASSTSGIGEPRISPPVSPATSIYKSVILSSATYSSTGDSPASSATGASSSSSVFTAVNNRVDMSSDFQEPTATVTATELPMPTGYGTGYLTTSTTSEIYEPSSVAPYPEESSGVVSILPVTSGATGEFENLIEYPLVEGVRKRSNVIEQTSLLWLLRLPALRVHPVLRKIRLPPP